jgi:GNAT superfamily N-acetyltransferase
MPHSTTTSSETVPATPEDITCILAWLKHEYDQDGEGFWCNHSLISEALDRPGNLWVIRRNGEAVAFQLGKYSADILSVRKDHRNRGLGTALVDASVERAFKDEVNALLVQCQPKQSLGFWERMGFVRCDDLEQFSNVMARRILPRTFDLGIAQSLIQVVIGFYPESATYGHSKDIRPIEEHHVSGVLTNDGSIMLDRRIVGLSHLGEANRDTVVKIEVDGVVRCFCKAKCEEAQAVGIQRDSWGGTYFIDCVNSIEDNA